ncbi:MAG: fibronectin type III domain-containing protein [candidate division Zixibacteria bacterium]|nr:fibronectin type III domain-containing protein [candidate division Zixibacteria bacterium]
MRWIFILGPGRTALIALLAVACVLGANVEARQIAITSLPFTYSASDQTPGVVDTLYIQGTKLTSTGNGISLMSSTSTALNNVVLNLGTDTVVFGTAGTPATGLTVNGPVSNRPRNIRILGGHILHQPSDTAVLDCRGVQLNGHEIIMDGTHVVIRGIDGKAMVGGGTNIYNVTVRNCRFASLVTAYYRRDYYTGACIHFDNCRSTTINTDYNGSIDDFFHLIFENNVIETCPHAAMVLYGRSEDGDYLKIKVLNNSITVDARNDYYTYPSGNIYYGTSNAYGIVTTFLTGGSEISGNTIRSGTNHEGGRGLYIGSMRLDVMDTVKIYNNDIDVHQGPGDYYRPMPAHGLRVRQSDIANLHIKGNTITARSDNNPATIHTDQIAMAFRWSPYQGSSFNNVVEGNTFRAIGNGTGTTAAVCLDAAIIGGDGLTFRNNVLESSGAIIKWGEGNAGAPNHLFEQDTLRFIAPDNGHITYDLGHLGNNWDCSNNRVRDMVYQNGTSDTDIRFAVDGDLELTVERTLQVRVLGNNGLPVSGAAVTVLNNYGQTVLSGLTDGNGRRNGAVSYLYRSRTGGDSTNFNSFSIKVKKGTDSTMITHTVNATSQVPAMTLQNTTGEEGTEDVIPPAAIDDLGALPGDEHGDITLSWTAPGDDDNAGQADRYEVRYSLNPITTMNWSQASLAPAPPTPATAGTSESFVVSNLNPGVRYYVAVRSYDESENASPVSNGPQSFAAGIASPAPQNTSVDDDAGSVVVAAGLVASYYSLRYEFALDTASAFTTATFATGLASGSQATATFDNLEEDILYFWRCRAIATDNSDTSAWSQSVSFDISTGVVATLTESDMAYPLDGAVVSTALPSLHVRDVAGVTTVYFQLADNAAFDDAVESGAVATTAGQQTVWEVPDSLMDDVTYYWRISPDNAVWTGAATFTYDAASAVAAAPDIHPYPNPFRPSDGHTDVTFTNLLEDSKLTIMTVSGTLVLVKDNLPAGDWTWDGRNDSGSEVSTGAYFYYVSYPSGTASGKLLIIR